MRHKSNTLGKYRNSSLYRATVSFLPCGLWCPGDCGAPEGSLSFAKQLYVFILHKLATYVTSIRFRYVLAPPSMAAHANLLQIRTPAKLTLRTLRGTTVSRAPSSPGRHHIQSTAICRMSNQQKIRLLLDIYTRMWYNEARYSFLSSGGSKTNGQF